MTRCALALCLSGLALLAGSPASAQDTPPPIGPFVVDIRATLPKFPQSLFLASSRGLTEDELPGGGDGLDVGAHVYLLHWKIATLGVGGQFTFGRVHSSALEAGGVVVAPGVAERFTSVAPQISFNFGTGDGWSYIGGGVGESVWSIVPDGAEPLPSDQERLMTINYGVGARWFKGRVAFTFDLRFYTVSPSVAAFGYPGGPRITFVILGAGVSIK
jgi:hypothetical protein